MLRIVLAVTLLLAGALFPFPLSAAQDAPSGKTSAEEKKDANKTETKSERAFAAQPRTSVTKHQVRIGGKEISYTATAGELPIQTEAGETEARIFYVAYRAEARDRSKPRPLLFIFNGGPGAASVWLHLGALGPRRVEMLPDGNMPAPPFHLVDNAYSWLDLADLVFVDPVGTGYSRAEKPDLTKNFTTVKGDIESLGSFIRLYLTRNERWNSPLFLVGESYGSFRAAGLSEYLVEHGMALSGLIEISTVLNMQTISFDNGNDLPYQLFLPSYTATAWYHKKLDPDLQADLDKTLSAVEQWAAGEYQDALNKGDRLSEAQRQAVVAKMARFTGLSPSFIDNRNLRIDQTTFARELLRDSRRMTGLMDSRLTAANVEPSAHRGFDPTITTIRPPFTSAMNSYVREELGFQSDREYYVLGGGIGHWDWEAKNSYADTSDNLRNALAKNPYMKVMVASGLFDLATPHFATEYTLAHLGVTPELRRNISERRYRSGHMMYLDLTALAQLKYDVADFITKTVKEQAK